MKQYKAYAKVNIFLKITGTRNNYHEILSRFMRVENLFDTLYFKEKLSPSKEFVLEGDFSCSTQQNTIYKAYTHLLEYTHSQPLQEWMEQHAIVVKKSIPAFAGLGGGSSDAATYLMMCNEVLDLGLSTSALMEIGVRVGADVPFFLSGYQSANVRGIGEIIEPFEEDVLPLDIYTPDIEISTPKVYGVYREHFFHPIDANTQQQLASMSSLAIMQKYTPLEANDLFAPAMQLYPLLRVEHKEGYFFSGSGSSFFRVHKDGK